MYNLTYLDLYQNDVCGPDNSEFKNWLRMREHIGAPACGTDE